MKIDELEKKLVDLQNEVRSSQDKISRLGKRLKTRENELKKLQDIEDIKRLQRCYGYYYEHGMADEIAELFADGADAAVTFRGLGTFLGENAKKNWQMLPGKDSPEFLHFLMMCSGIIDIAQGGKTAKGRWYGWGIVAVPYGETISHTSFGAVYENEYAKQDGKWKIKKLDVSMSYKIKNFAEGFVDPKKVAVYDPEYVVNKEEVQSVYDVPDYTKTEYPSGYTHPFHFKHPVTGKKTREAQRNTYFNKLRTADK